MILRLENVAAIDNLRNYPSETVAKLLELLVAGAKAHPDPRRKNFYDVENGSRVFFIHITPNRKVLLLATWLKPAAQEVPAASPELVATQPSW